MTKVYPSEINFSIHSTKSLIRMNTVRLTVINNSEKWENILLKSMKLMNHKKYWKCTRNIDSLKYLLLRSDSTKILFEPNTRYQVQVLSLQIIISNKLSNSKYFPKGLSIPICLKGSTYFELCQPFWRTGQYEKVFGGSWEYIEE